MHRLLIVAIALTCAVYTGAQTDTPAVVMISIDGLMPSRYTGNDGANIPRLRKLKDDGAWATGVVGVLPTVTYPSHTSLVTGVPPAVHGIFDNRILDPENRSNAAWYWYARQIQAPTLQGAARARGLRTGAVSWPVTVGLDADYVVPEFWRSSHPESLILLKAMSRPDDLLDAIEIAEGHPFGWPQTDRHRTTIASYLLRTRRPDLLLLHLIELDGAQHNNGPGTPEATRTLEKIDGYIGEIVDAIAQAGMAGRTQIVIVSDHGFLAVQQMLQPNAALKQEGLITANDRGTITDWKAYFHSSGGSGFIYLKDPADVATRDRVAKILETLKANPANGIQSIWTRDDLAKLGAHPDAAFGLDVVNGFYTGGGFDALVKPSTSKGGHGFAPDRPELHSSFIVNGPRLAKRGSLGVIRMTQIAPTLARLLEIGLSPKADQPLAIW
ncbi:MAG TPA: ectonucleotide pyrophosphatase/phosphodiesterase [Vicinamibacterales bacterium]|jgi:predicted AlkP superfamily pyrophosphatase or phosphodiesterase